MTVYNNILLSEMVYYKIGGSARFLLEIRSNNDVADALEFVSKNNILKILPLGLGSNVLINDKEFNGAVLRFVKPKTDLIQEEDNLVKVFASHNLDDVIQYFFHNNYIGLEWAGGLPSTVGAAVRGNVGAFGGEIKDSIEKVEIVEKVGNELVRKELTRDDLQFSYRNSILKHRKDLIVSIVYFHFQKANSQQLEKAKAEYVAHIEYRATHHPMEYPSCGSVFKNITKKEDTQRILMKWPDVRFISKEKWHNKIAMGYVVNRLGLSGKQIGGAQISEKHANYIVNKNNATFNDVFGLIDQIKEKFYQEFGFYPEPEVEIIA